MAKVKTIAANAEKLGANDQEAATDSAVKFISEFPEFRFALICKDEHGKTIYKTDANGNNKTPEIKEYSFVKVNGHKDPKTGKVDPNTAFSFFIVSKEDHGSDYDTILKRLRDLSKNPMYYLYTEDDYFAHRNPEAFRIAKEKVELETERDQWKAKAEELERKLGFRKQ
jgi:hypothetical protein